MDVSPLCGWKSFNALRKGPLPFVVQFMPVANTTRGLSVTVTPDGHAQSHWSWPLMPCEQAEASQSAGQVHSCTIDPHVPA